MQALNCKTKFYTAWSGGKDACLALYKMQQQGHVLTGLLTMMNSQNTLSRAHHLPKELIAQQAKALGVPLFAHPTSHAEYQTQFQAALSQMKQAGTNHLVLGDIDLQAHQEWQQQQGKLTETTPLFPLWLQDHTTLVQAFLQAGFQATIISILPQKVPAEFLGKPFNLETIQALDDLNIDVCAEGGEFHTVVTNGPNFSHPITLNVNNATLRTDGDYGYHYLDFSPPQ